MQILIGAAAGVLATALIFLFVTGVFETRKQRAERWGTVKPRSVLKRPRVHVLEGGPADLEVQYERYNKITAAGYEPVWSGFFGWMPGDEVAADEQPRSELEVLTREFDHLHMIGNFTREHVEYAMSLARKIDKLKEINS